MTIPEPKIKISVEPENLEHVLTEEFKEKTLKLVRLHESAPAILNELKMLISQARDTLGTVDEFIAMPCDSLRDRMNTGAHRLRIILRGSREFVSKIEGIES